MQDIRAREAAIMQSLECYAERAGDPGPEVYARFFAKYPQAAELFGNDAGNYLKSRMFERLLVLLIDLASGTVHPSFSAYWVSDHVAWDVEHAMIVDMFDMLVATLRDGIAGFWTADMDTAWASLIADFMPAIDENLDEALAIRAGFRMAAPI